MVFTTKFVRTNVFSTNAVRTNIRINVVRTYVVTANDGANVVRGKVFKVNLFSINGVRTNVLRPSLLEQLSLELMLSNKCSAEFQSFEMKFCKTTFFGNILNLLVFRR
jgi:hypothetical protein